MNDEVVGCSDCGFEYGSLGWVDVLVPDDVWAIINPITPGTYNIGGLLCFNCIMKRCEKDGIKTPVSLMSGPVDVDNIHRHLEERYIQLSNKYHNLLTECALS